jgi:histidinol-phosphate aminotransferase
LDVQRENLVIGNGSCELLMLLGESFLGPDRHIVFPHPSFVVYRSIAQARGAEFTGVDLVDMDYDLDGMLAAIQGNTSLLIICNPNNPTGSYIQPAALKSFLERVPRDVVVVLDEAYGEFVTAETQEDTVPWLSDYPNLVILRTFSKIYGLAGMRVGYGIAGTTVIEALDKVRQPFNVNHLSQVAATECLKHLDKMLGRRDLIAGERGRVGQALTEMGVPYHPSEANFLWIDITHLGIPGPEVPQTLLEMGLMTRSGYAMGCPGWIRVTIGEAEDNDLFLEAINELRHPQRQPVEHVGGGADAEALSPES